MIYIRGLQTFLSEGHICCYTIVWGPGFLRNVIALRKVAFHQIPNFSLTNYYYFIIDKMASRAWWNGFAGRIWPAGRSLETPDLYYCVEFAPGVRWFLQNAAGTLALPRTAPVRLVRHPCGSGCSRSSLRKWGMAPSAACECCLEEQTFGHVVLKCPIHRPPHGLHDLTVLDDETIEWLLNTCPEI